MVSQYHATTVVIRKKKKRNSSKEERKLKLKDNNESWETNSTCSHAASSAWAGATTIVSRKKKMKKSKSNKEERKLKLKNNNSSGKIMIMQNMMGSASDTIRPDHVKSEMMKRIENKDLVEWYYALMYIRNRVDPKFQHIL